MNNTRNLRKMISFTLGSVDLSNVRKEMSEGWSVVHLSNKGKNFIGILEKDFIRYDEANFPIVYIPPRKKISW
jgi:hypothetical protein